MLLILSRDIRLVGFIFLLLSQISLAQSLERLQIDFIVDGERLAMPLGGGLNTPQFSAINLNQDSLLDLFVFDRSGNKVLTFIAEERGKYAYEPSYEQLFPDLQDWVLLRDFNQDSLSDIFTASKTGIQGIDVYRGLPDGTFLQIDFDNPVKVLGYPSSSGVVTNIYVSRFDIPDISDIDGDGDLDILTFETGGTKLYMYQNYALEDGLGTDTLNFRLTDKCWGRLVESFNTNDLILSDDSTTCPNNNRTFFPRLHGGSTVMTFDPDRDGDADVILGDFSYETILFLTNGGSNKNAWVTDQTPDFPRADNRVEVPYFPAAFQIDIDHNQTQDLIFCPNQMDARSNVRHAKLYVGDGNGPQGYEMQNSAFLNDQMIDLGTDASPTLLDYNGDGLKDILVGSRFHEDYDPDFPSQLFLFKNIGTASHPSYELVDRDWLSLRDIIDEIDALAPTCADLDGDGDLDLIIGNKRGKLIHIENLGIPGGSFEVGAVTYPWFDIDVGFSSFPAFVDIDQDGLLDMLIGEERGNINYFRNLGDLHNPVFDSDLTAEENLEEFGGVDARQDNAVFGRSTPTVFTSQDTTFLIVGTSFGNFLLYDISNVDGTETFEPLIHPISAIIDGGRSRCVVGDMNENNKQELVIGHGRGGISIYKTEYYVEGYVSSVEVAQNESFSLYPNPVYDILTVKLADTRLRTIKVINNGGKVLTQYQGRDRIVKLFVADLTPGLYFTTVTSEFGTVAQSWIKI